MGSQKFGVTRPIEVNLSHKSDGLKRFDVAFGLAYRLIGSQQGFVMIRLTQFFKFSIFTVMGLKSHISLH